MFCEDFKPFITFAFRGGLIKEFSFIAQHCDLELCTIVKKRVRYSRWIITYGLLATGSTLHSYRSKFKTPAISLSPFLSSLQYLSIRFFRVTYLCYQPTRKVGDHLFKYPSMSYSTFMVSDLPNSLLDVTLRVYDLLCSGNVPSLSTSARSFMSSLNSSRSSSSNESSFS